MYRNYLLIKILIILAFYHAPWLYVPTETTGGTLEN